MSDSAEAFVDQDVAISSSDVYLHASTTALSVLGSIHYVAVPDVTLQTHLSDWLSKSVKGPHALAEAVLTTRGIRPVGDGDSNVGRSSSVSRACP
eukprot:scaffold518_cov388-Prasinococcus_capsulatus_cf.AAC.45